MPGQRERGAKRPRPAEDGPSAGVVALHRARFVQWQPAGIVALAASGDASLLAAAREDGDIELYETATNHCFQRIPGHKDSCLTCVALVDEEEGKGGLTSRLLTGGLDGALVEWDVEQRRAGPAADSLGGAVWQLAPEPGACIKQEASARVAAACDDGCARIFVAEWGAPGLVYSKTLPRVEGRCLAVAWHPSGEVLATAGTDGCIHLWNVASGHEVLRITAGDGTGASKEGCIWSLVVLPDGTVVSGDSAGNVQFWDGRFGTLLAGFSQHQADVLQLAASADGNMVFAAGVDPQLALFHRLPEGTSTGSGKQLPWAYLSSKRPHSHDVRAVVAAGGRLFTGSNDTQLLSHSVERYLKEHPVRMNGCPQLPILQAARSPAAAGAEAAAAAEPSGGAQREQQAPWLLCVQRNEIDLWALPDAALPAQLGAPAEGGFLEPSSAPEYLLRIAVQSGRHVAAAALSQDGRWLAHSDARRVSCFALEERPGDDAVPDDHVMPSALRLPADLPPACHLAFRPGTAELLASSTDGTLRILDLAALQQRQQDGGSSSGDEDEGSGEGEAVQTVRALHDLQYKSSLRRDRLRSAARRLMPLVELLAVSPDGSWLAAVVRQRVHLVNLSTHKLVHSLPPLAEPQPAITALAFTADSTAVVVAAATHQVAAYGVTSGQPTDWSKQHSGSLPPKLLRMPGSIVCICSSPAAPGSLFLQSGEACCHLDMGAAVEGEGADGQGRKRRRVKPPLTSEPPGANCRMIYCSDPVLHAEYLGPESLLVVERPWSEVYKSVAAPMFRHRYGT
ncbi:WD40 repeat [Chlorella sorokiniana]|uniref:WD40 repeat n=1 Tax=Chlorella sorokiniana TaxID=3076 RepID=A0A2P6U489_CHLSO|nr:WD40 repeat [Chlorella sorokiniana]|eukprot:PRW61122.1 WD40 repeat [Chlorella sorokiniana]